MYFILGVLVGFFASLPPGPINIFSISQALRFGFWKSVSIRLTVSALDATYCFICTVFASLMISFLNRWTFVLRLASIAVILAAGINLLRLAKTHRVRVPDLSLQPLPNPRVIRVGHPALFTFLLYVSSPTLPVFWLSVGSFFTSHGLVGRRGIEPLLFALSCGLGSLIYYMLVARLGAKLQRIMKPGFFERAYTIMGLVLLVIAVITLVAFFLEPQGTITHP